METMPTEWFVGIDEGRQAHVVRVLDARGRLHAARTFAHSGRTLIELATWLDVHAPGPRERVAVALERPHGPLVELLLERGYAVYAINPKQVDRFRDRYSVAGAKDDGRDAFVLADTLRTDGARFRRLRPEAAAILELRSYARLVAQLKEDRVRLGNRLREELWRYYPQALTVTDDVGAPWFLEVLRLAPTPAAAVRLRRPRVAAVLARRRIRRVTADDVVAALRAPAVPAAAGTVKGASACVQVLAAQLDVLNGELARCEQALDACCTALAAADASDDAEQRGEQRDVAILQSLPGVGRIVLATLLADASDPLRRRDYHTLRLLSGAAPVTRQSGKRRAVVMRRACQPRLRDAVFHWSNTARQHDPRLRAAYDALIARGHSHGRALRSIGDRLLAMACVMLRDGTLYDPARRMPRAA